MLNKNLFLAFSPTNKGAILIGGKTIHSVYYRYKSKKTNLFRALEKTNYIFVDEVSMMIKDFYQLFTMIKRTFGNIKFIISGDFGQLPPVNDNWTGDYENSPVLKLLCGCNRILLTKCRRADSKLFELCKNVDKLDFKNFVYEEFIPKTKTYLNIALTHKTRITINDECMKRYLLENKNKNTVLIPMDKYNVKTQNVVLTEGMPIIAHKTFSIKEDSINILNSQRFTITNVSEEHICLPMVEKIIK